MASSSRDSAAMLAAFGIIAYGASMLVHEAGGHGLYCLAMGGHTVMLTAWGERCSIAAPGIEAAGPAVQFAAGLLSWLVVRVLPQSRANLRAWLWLFGAFDLLVSTGYVAFSGITGFGDAAVLIAGLSPPLLWRAILVVGGAAAYYLAIRLGALGLTRLAGAGRARRRRFAWIPYVAATVMACGGALLNVTEPSGLALKLAIASAAGGGAGLLFLPGIGAGEGDDGPAPVTTRAGWLMAGVAAATAFVLVLGRGIAAG